VDDSDRIVAALSPTQWFEVIVGAEDGPWPPCCGNVSVVRDRLVAVVCGGGELDWVAAAQALRAELGDHLDPQSPVGRLYDVLVGVLDARRPGWADLDVVAEDADLDEFMLRVMLAGSSSVPAAELTTFDVWGPVFADAIAFAETPPPDALGEWFVGLRDRFDALRAAGAPVPVVAAAYQDAVRRARLGVRDA
jgi:hypothetical protein